MAKMEIMPTADPTLETPLLQELKMEQETTNSQTGTTGVGGNTEAGTGNTNTGTGTTGNGSGSGNSGTSGNGANDAGSGSKSGSQVLAEADDKRQNNLFSLFFKLHLIFKTNLFYFNYL